jgi:glutathione S-transferase
VARALEKRAAHEHILSFQEELGVPYTIKKWERTANASAPKELKAVHPLGVAPVIEDDGMVIAESGAIVGMCVKLVSKLMTDNI